MHPLKNWLHRYFSDPQIVILLLSVVISVGLIIWIGDILAPVLASIVIAYLLETGVRQLERVRVPRLGAVLIVFVLFICLLVGVVIGLVPILSRQASQFFGALPDMVTHFQTFIMSLPQRYPNIISPDQAHVINTNIQTEITHAGKAILSYSLTSLLGVFTFLVYLVLMPLMVFFFLKDKQSITAWAGERMPRNRQLIDAVWVDVNAQIANFIRGKVWEIFMVWGASWIVFALMGLHYAVLLSLLVGLSVVVPYVGAIAVTLPVVAVAWLQFGLVSHFWWLMLWYAVIHTIDGNVLIPLLYSEAVNIHPVAIIVAVLFFGGIWGFWGVFFAIPLATLVNAVMGVWLRRVRETSASPPTID